MVKAYRYRLYPTVEQRTFLEKTFGCCRFVWNTLLADAMSNYELHRNGKTDEKPNVTGIGFVKALTPLKGKFDFLSEVATEALQQKLLDLGKAYQGFFKGKGFPKYKSKRHHQTFRLMSRYFSIRDNGLFVSRGNSKIKVKWDSRKLPSPPSQVTISRDPAGRYFASFLCEIEVGRSCGEGQVGIDLGLKDLMTLSTGESVPNPRHYNRHFKALQKAQRQLCRKVKGSKNRNKQRLKVAKLHARIADVRRDYLHQLSTRLVNENQVICLEALRVKNMMRNRRLARHIADVGWGMLVNMLKYKAAESGCAIMLVDTWYPSTQTCHHCDHRLTGEKKLTLKDRIWMCPKCDTTHDRDINAAANILKFGLSMEPIPGHVALATMVN